ncbi:hypothetical protein HPB51_022067 [Rhipicephalus microplus]|uniref:Uncharacterized protein n=1 Tax=Rhipicephalus microplus TaxID=6941 RepID=A0A9J6F912_RHIMP|nr:hypothetical protein HPB51_022067 [Rhipicephalus microplus]
MQYQLARIHTFLCIQSIDVGGLTSQNHYRILRDAVEKGSVNFYHLGFFNVCPNSNTRFRSLFAYIEIAAAAAVIRCRDLREKLDGCTRRWPQAICPDLVLVDEMQTVSEVDRGAILEAVLTRVKLLRRRDGPRFVGVCGCVENAKDVRLFKYTFPASARPVPLKRVVLGYPCSATSDFRFDVALSYKLAAVISAHSAGKPALVVSVMAIYSIERAQSQ